MEVLDKKSKITSFQELIAWQRGHQLVLDVYKCTSGFPKEEKYGNPVVCSELVNKTTEVHKIVNGLIRGASSRTHA